MFPAGEYTIGSIDDEPDRNKNETRHPVKLTRPVAVLDREITFEELIAFSPKYTGFMQQYDARPADAGFGADWYDAVGFCRWLGQQSGLSEGDQCYANPESLDKEQYPREPNPEANWAPRNWPLELARRGFRLPTESEWEVASCAGARTAYGFGSEVSLLGRFGWFAENSGKHVHPPRRLRPSIRGLFDLHGNLFEWTHDWMGDYGVEAMTDPLGAKGGSDRVIRGGGWDNGAAFCRSAIRGTNAPTFRSTQRRLSPGPESVGSLAGGARRGGERSHRAEARRERLRSSDRSCRSLMAHATLALPGEGVGTDRATGADLRIGIACACVGAHRVCERRRGQELAISAVRVTTVGGGRSSRARTR